MTGYLCRNTRVVRFFVGKEMHMNYEKLSGFIRTAIDCSPENTTAKIRANTRLTATCYRRGATIFAAAGQRGTPSTASTDRGIRRSSPRTTTARLQSGGAAAPGLHYPCRHRKSRVRYERQGTVCHRD